jgi:hypothetical protein
MKRLSQRASAEDDESSWESVGKHCNALDSTRHDAGTGYLKSSMSFGRSTLEI